MGSDFKRLIRVTPRGVDWCAKQGLDAPEGTWLQVNGVDDAEALARDWKAPLVDWDIQTAADVVVITAQQGTRVVRSLTYDPEGGWSVSGKPLPFEDGPALRKWLKRKRLLASPDGYDVLAAFLGGPWDESTKLAREPEVVRPPPKPVKRSALDVITDAWVAREWRTVVALLKKSKGKGLGKFPNHMLVGATANDELDAMRLLLAAKVDPNKKDGAGDLPLPRARSREAIALLLKAKAKIDLKNGDGQTALIAAVTNLNPQSAECVRALLDAGANPSQTFDGQSPVQLAKAFARAHKSAKPWADAVVPMLEPE